MDDPLSIIGGAVIVLALGANFLLSMSEAALISVSDIALRRRAEKGDRRAVLIREMRATNDYLSAVIVGINLTIIVISTLMTVILHRQLGEGAHLETEMWQLGMIAFILVFCEITPKTWGALMAERVALVVAPAVHVTTVLTRPLMYLLSAFCNRCLRLSGTPAVHSRHFITAEEIQAAADIGEEEGLVQPEEGEMLDSVLELGETTVREIMVPRVDVIAIDSTASLADAVQTIVEHGYSRIPVYERTIDNVVGLLYANDLLAAFRDGKRDGSLLELVRQPLFVPETKRVSELFRELRDQSVHIAVVIDEFGGTEGLVTIEDILEELVGDIADEHDSTVEDLVLVSENEAVADARCEIEQIIEKLDVELPEGQYETIGGLITGEMGCIPAAGTVLEQGQVRLVVEQGTDQAIERVRIVKLHADGGDK